MSLLVENKGYTEFGVEVEGEEVEAAAAVSSTTAVDVDASVKSVGGATSVMEESERQMATENRDRERGWEGDALQVRRGTGRVVGVEVENAGDSRRRDVSSVRLAGKRSGQCPLSWPDER